jgi:hypothetical protein
MLRVHVICEGPTEEAFVNELLAPSFRFRDLFLLPSVIGQPGKKGGDVRQGRLIADLRNRLLGDRGSICTTLLDYYGLPSEFPGKEDAGKFEEPIDKAATMCKALKLLVEREIGDNSLRRFIPYVQMHEFEGLLFSDPANFAKGIEKPSLEFKFARIRDEFSTPEHINDSPQTAPSKRIISLFPDNERYEKPTMGRLAATAIGLDKMRQECPLFDSWLAKLEDLPPLPA